MHVITMTADSEDDTLYALLATAEIEGDWEQVAVCERAIWGMVTVGTLRALGAGARADAMALTQRAARRQLGVR